MTADHRAASGRAGDGDLPAAGRGTSGHLTRGYLVADTDGPHVAGLSTGWQRTVVWWDRAFYAVLALTALATWFVPESQGPRPGLTFVALAGLLAAYLLWGRRAARSRSVGLAMTYLVLLVVGTTVAVAQTTVGTFLLFAAFSQIWMLSDKIWHGVLLTTVLAASVTVGLASQGGLTSAHVAEVVPEMGVVLVFSVGLGIWVATSMRRTETFARTLDELEAAREALAEAHRAEGVAAERERLAREIHDTLAQGFTSIVMLSQAVRTDVERGRNEAAVERLALVERTARDNLAEARALVAAFAPVGLADQGIADALRRLAERFGTETGIGVEVRLPEPMPVVGREHEVILLRAAQEALTNVRRHAGASAVLLALEDADGVLTLQVDDDGHGIAPDTAEGFGLRGMRDRVASGGGEVAVGPRPEGGTRLAVRLPALDPAAHPSGREEGQA